MKINCQSFRPGPPGFALLVTLCVMLACLIIFASVLSWSLTNSQITQQNIQYNMSENAAEAAVSRVIGQEDRDFIYSVLSNGTVYASLPATICSNWPVQYIFSATNGATGQVSVAISSTTVSAVALNSQYAGLSGLVQSNDVYATATPIGQRYNVPATIHESTQFATIPLFQFAIFYNVNLEIDPGSTMTVSGPVFCNQSIWEGSDVLTFASTVTAVGTNCVANSSMLGDPFASGYNGTGTPTFSVPNQPMSQANSLVMPIGTNNNPNTILGLLNLPPPAYAMGTAAAYSTNGLMYPANAADLVISNSVNGTNWGSLTPMGTNLFVYYQDSAVTPALTLVPYDFYIMTNRTAAPHLYFTNNAPAPAYYSNILYAGFSWVTNVLFYDWREGWNGGSGPPKMVQAVQIDVGKLNTWLTNQTVPVSGYTYDQLHVTHTGGHIAGIYVYNSVLLTNNISGTNSQMPAVRMVNGAQLINPGTPSVPRGMTVATPFPMYVLGNYNSQNNGLSALGLWATNSTVTGATANTLPAALMADAITILSTNWSDANSLYTNKNTCTGGGPAPGNTTVNAAMLEGIVASNPNISGNYSGGVENFLRLLENWGTGPGNSGTQQALTYNGSIVVLFYSQVATNSWQPTGNYYNPPHRQWAFDMNFQNALKIPPMTPATRAMIRGNWYAHQ